MAKGRVDALVVRPVVRARAPRYPTFESFAAEPALLMRYVPARWRKSRIALGALAAFALGRVASGDSASPVEAKANLAPQTASPRVAHAPSRAIVAPVFVHGEGRGSPGCVALAPPVFLSEAEALVILWDELGNAGLGFERRPHAAAVPAPKPGARPLVYDLWSPSLHLGVTFVGQHNYEALLSRAHELTAADIYGSRTTGGIEYDTLALAQQTAEELREARAESAVVLYDPLARIRFDTFDHPRPPVPPVQIASAEARRLLRAQVEDFLDWARTHLAHAAVTP